MEVVEHSSTSGMAMFSDCHYTFHTELVHGCSAILIVYQSVLSSFISYTKVLVRPDDPGMDRGSLCFRACSSVLLVHPKGGRPGDGRVVTSYTGMVLSRQRQKPILSVLAFVPSIAIVKCTIALYNMPGIFGLQGMTPLKMATCKISAHIHFKNRIHELKYVPTLTHATHYE